MIFMVETAKVVLPLLVHTPLYLSSQGKLVHNTDIRMDGTMKMFLVILGKVRTEI